jgi:hypothetical protein
MNILAASRDTTTGVALTAVLAATRVGHFGGIAMPPDATLAVFFLLGLWLTSPRWLALALLSAAAVDALAIARGASSYCITPAYPLLVPTYAALWGAGCVTRVYARLLSVQLRGLALTAALFCGVTVAFVVSNAGFYTLSGYFQVMPAADYARAVSQYFVPYLETAVVYVVIAIAVRWLLLRVAAGRSDPVAASR